MDDATMGNGRRLYQFGPFELDRAARVVFCGGQPVMLAPRTVDTLIALVESAGRVLTKEDLLHAIWGNRAVEDVNLTQQISLLRRALSAKDPSTEYIRNFSGRGYQFAAPVHPIAADEPPAPPPALATPPPRDVPGARPGGRWLALLAAALVLTAGAALLWRLRTAPTPSADLPAQRFPLCRLPGSKFHPALSPDGARVAFIWKRDEGAEPCVYSKTEGREEPELIPGSCGNPSSPAWSPAGFHLAYLRNRSGGTELVVHGDRGQDRVLASFFPLRSLIANRLVDWSPDGKWIVVSGKRDAEMPLTLYLVSPATGEQRVLTHPPLNAIGDTDPAISPDGSTIAFCRMGSRFNMTLLVTPVAGGASRPILAGNQLIGGVAWSPDGRSVLFSANRSRGGYQLWRADPSRGPVPPVPDTSGVFAESPIHLSVSPGSAKLAYVVSGQDLNIWRLHLSAPGGKPQWSRLIASAGVNAAPQYSPDGTRICFLSDRSGQEQIWVANSGGTQLRQLTRGRMAPGHCSWSPDGSNVLFVAHEPGLGSSIFSIPAAGGNPRRVPIQGGGSLPVAAPDGRTLYLVQTAGNRWELFSANLANGQTAQVTHQGAHRARLSRDGRWIYYIQSRTSSVIRRIRPDGTEDQFVLNGLIPGYFGAWALGTNGVYYLSEDRETQRAAVLFAQDGVPSPRRLTDFPTPLAPLGFVEFSLSPDQKSLLAVLCESHSSDLMAIDGFR